MEFKEDKFEDLLGKTLVSIEKTEDELTFTTTEGEVFKSYHNQDCCESVEIEDICGDLQDLIGTPITLAEETFKEGGESTQCESSTYTFYKFATVKGYVDLRWYGISDGYYSERVSLVENISDEDAYYRWCDVEMAFHDRGDEFGVINVCDVLHGDIKGVVIKPTERFCLGSEIFAFSEFSDLTIDEAIVKAKELMSNQTT
mgnify:CR=1 FL=1